MMLEPHSLSFCLESFVPIFSFMHLDLCISLILCLTCNQIMSLCKSHCTDWLIKYLMIFIQALPIFTTVSLFARLPPAQMVTKKEEKKKKTYNVMPYFLCLCLDHKNTRLYFFFFLKLKYFYSSEVFGYSYQPILSWGSIEVREAVTGGGEMDWREVEDECMAFSGCSSGRRGGIVWFWWV